MYTYQDFEAARTGGEVREWIYKAVVEYKSSELYQTANIGDEYARQRNTTIMAYQKFLYTVEGKKVPDLISANHKICSNFFNRFVTGQASYSLGNGASFKKEATKKKLGKDFDKMLYTAGKKALIHGVAYGFFNLDHLEVFTALEFVPLYDEENGTLRAGIRFWQIDAKKPLRVTLYEEDGYTEYILRNGVMELYAGDGGKTGKKAYVDVVNITKADGAEIVAGENYPSFPIVPLWGNMYHQSEIVGIRSQIDAYDLIKSGFANDLDDVAQIYWILENTGGMTDVDLAEFVQRLKTLHAASAGDEDGAHAESHTIEIPYQSRDVYLDKLKKDMYEDYMALDIEHIASGATTATQIRAAYEGPNEKADEYEMNVTDFVQEILRLMGITDEEVTFSRSAIVNQQEMITTLVAASASLPQPYVTKKIVEILGDIDKANEILEQMEDEEGELMDMKGGKKTGGGKTDENEEEQREKEAE